MKKTVEIDDVFYTYDDIRDDPNRIEQHYAWPNEWIGVGTTAAKSKEAYKLVEQKVADLKAWAEWLQIHGTDAYLQGEYPKK